MDEKNKRITLEIGEKKYSRNHEFDHNQSLFVRFTDNVNENIVFKKKRIKL